MGLSKMYFPKFQLALVSKLLGTGSGLGFSRVPNLGQYVHLGIWKNTDDSKKYEKSNILLRLMKKFATEVEVHQLIPYRSHGVWDGKNPYPNIQHNENSNEKVVVLTRAKVKFKFLYSFWKNVGPCNKSLTDSKGRLFSAGLGEWPFSHPITYSIWENLDAAKNFAYQQPQHAAAIAGAKGGKWFKEDLFVRYELYFQPH